MPNFPSDKNGYIPRATGQVVDGMELIGTGVFSPDFEQAIIEATERLKTRPPNKYVQIVPAPKDR